MSNDYEVIPQVGEIWADMLGDCSLVVDINRPMRRCKILVLSGNQAGRYHDNEPWADWNDMQKDGMPFYRILLS